MCPQDPPPDEIELDALRIRYLIRLELDRNDESGIVTGVAVRLSSRAPAAYRAEVAEKLSALYPSADVVVG